MSTFTFAALLMILSGSLHATVNAMIKSGGDRLLSSALLTFVSSLIALPLLFIVPLPTGAWHWLLIGTIIHVAYFILLSKTLDTGDFSAAYPVYRGTAPLFTAIITIGVLREPIALQSIIGILAIGGGILMMLVGKHMSRRMLVLSFATGLMTALYTVVDAAGVRIVENPLSFILWLFFLFGILNIIILPMLTPNCLIEAARTQYRSAVIAGTLSLGTFGIALYALSLGPTAELAALRETGMLTATAISVLFLGESVTKGRLFAMLAICLGAILILL